MNIYRQKIVPILIVAAMLIGFGAVKQPSQPVAAQSATSDNADVAVAWFDLQLDLSQSTPGFTPPVVSRAFAYSGIALYESIVPSMDGFQSLGGRLQDLGPVPYPIAEVEYDYQIIANSVLYEMTHYLYFNTSQDNFDKIDELYDRWLINLSAGVDPAIVERSEMQGRIVANAILIWSLSDGGYRGQLSNFPASYVPPTGRGLWVPTPRPNGDPLAALQPYWGENRTFAVTLEEQCFLVPPPEYSEDPDSAFYGEAYEVYETVQNLTAEQNEIALFWSDDPGTTPTPPGHSISILNQVLVLENASLQLAAEAYAKVGMSQADAFIVGWYYKYRYNLIRPITYIQNLIDPDWNTPIITDPVVTPPFPEYPSGHSVQSGASAQVLTDLFGDQYTFTDHTHDERGLTPRSFNSFYAFADEAAISRLYGGIHFRAAIELGVENGKCIGSVVSAMPFHASE
jgi:hypothetical protein